MTLAQGLSPSCGQGIGRGSSPLKVWPELEVWLPHSHGQLVVKSPISFLWGLLHKAAWVALPHGDWLPPEQVILETQTEAVMPTTT